MDREQNIEKSAAAKNIRRGQIYAANAGVIPEALVPYIESELRNGNNVYVDMHGTLAVREAYVIPEAPSITQTSSMVEEEVVSVR